MVRRVIEDMLHLLDERLHVRIAFHIFIRQRLREPFLARRVQERAQIIAKRAPSLRERTERRDFFGVRKHRGTLTLPAFEPDFLCPENVDESSVDAAKAIAETPVLLFFG